MALWRIDRGATVANIWSRLVFYSRVWAMCISTSTCWQLPPVVLTQSPLIYICEYIYGDVHTFTLTDSNIYIYTYMHSCAYTLTHTHMQTYTHTYTHTYKYVHPCILIHIYTHQCIQTYIHIYTCTYALIYTYMHSYTLTHIHTYKCKNDTLIHIQYTFTWRTLFQNAVSVIPKYWFPMSIPAWKSCGFFLKNALQKYVIYPRVYVWCRKSSFFPKHNLQIWYWHWKSIFVYGAYRDLEKSSPYTYTHTPIHAYTHTNTYTPLCRPTLPRAVK